VDGDGDGADLVAVGTRLADAVEAVLPGWVKRSVEGVLAAWAGGADAGAALERADAEGRRAAAEVGEELRRLLAAEADRQWTNPLSLLRAAVRYPTAVLADAGVPPVVRDAFAERQFPEDPYGLTPASFADVDESLHELSIVWGATKAQAHLAARRASQ